MEEFKQAVTDLKSLLHTTSYRKAEKLRLKKKLPIASDAGDFARVGESCLYLNTDPKAAIEWLKRKDNDAVVALCHASQNFWTTDHEDRKAWLSPSDEWQQFVYYCRTGVESSQTVVDESRSWGFLYGPQACWPPRPDAPAEISPNGWMQVVLKNAQLSPCKYALKHLTIMYYLHPHRESIVESANYGQSRRNMKARKQAAAARAKQRFF